MCKLGLDEMGVAASKCSVKDGVHRVCGVPLKCSEFRLGQVGLS